MGSNVSLDEADHDTLFSVIIPTYNRKQFIIEAIDSVLNQTYENWEICIVDDGSTDNTYEEIEYLLKNPKIKYKYQENAGQSVARNNAILLSTGQYVCFLDSDNIWLYNRLEIASCYIENNPHADVIYGDSITIDINGKELTRKKIQKFSGRITHELLKDNFVSMNAALAKRECFEELGMFNEQDRLAEDYELWLRFSTQYSFLYVPEFMAKYRVMDDQLSTDKDKRFFANESIIKKFKKTYPLCLSNFEWNKGFSAFYVRKSNYERSVKRYKQSLLDVIKAFYHYPFWQGPWRSLVKLFIFRK